MCARDAVDLREDFSSDDDCWSYRKRSVRGYCGTGGRRTQSRDMPQVPNVYGRHGCDRAVPWVRGTRLPHVIHIILPRLLAYIEPRSHDRAPGGYPTMAWRSRLRV